MTYATISQIAHDPDLYQRLVACAAEQDKQRPYESWTWAYSWDIAASPGWAAAWESAVAGGNENPGADPAVITDAMILAVIQPMPAGMP